MTLGKPFHIMEDEPIGLIMGGMHISSMEGVPILQIVQKTTYSFYGIDQKIHRICYRVLEYFMTYVLSRGCMTLCLLCKNFAFVVDVISSSSMTFLWIFN